jgi:hypothetical protein
MYCIFFALSLYHRNKSYEEIRKHLIECTECVLEFEDAFESYLEGQRELTIMDELEMPEGISSREDFLKQLIISSAARYEEVEFSIESMHNKIDSLDVQTEILRLIRSQNNLMDALQKGVPRVIIEANLRIMEKTYRTLYELMGYRAFWCLMGQEIPSHGDDRNIAPIIEWWRKASLGAQ